MQAVRAKITSALESVPANAEVGALPSANHITYAHSVKIIELLQRTESSEKGMFGFGGYKSKALNDWAAIVKDYKRSLLLVAEAAQYLTRAVDFEFPALRNDVTRVEQRMIELSKKRSD